MFCLRINRGKVQAGINIAQLSMRIFIFKLAKPDHGRLFLKNLRGSKNRVVGKETAEEVREDG